jgi:hypothetical protein
MLTAVSAEDARPTDGRVSGPQVRDHRVTQALADPDGHGHRHPIGWSPDGADPREDVLAGIEAAL